MISFVVRIDTTNPDAYRRLIERLSLDPVGHDLGGRRYSTSITVHGTVCGIPGSAMYSAEQTCAEPDVLRTEIDAIVALIHRSGFSAGIVVEEIFALAARLLNAVDVKDPESEAPLGRDRTTELAQELGLREEVDATTDARTWVIAQLKAVCAGIARAWTAALEDRALTIAQLDRSPTTGWQTANAGREFAEEHWPDALRMIEETLHAAAQLSTATNAHNGGDTA